MPASIHNFLDHFAAVALGHIDREYPSKLDHVINDECELLGPRTLHPVFFGSFDWHSSVHGHWLLARALRLEPTLPQAGAIRGVFDRHFTASNVAAEVAYLRQRQRGTFERMYGWSWLLKLACELRLGAAAEGGSGGGGGARHAADFSRWAAALAPLESAFVQRYLSYLPKATYPIRVGTHTNSAFGLVFALDHARLTGDAVFESMIARKAMDWYAGDRDCPAWEPDGSDFFSPALMEAECMRRIMPSADFLAWFDRFLPGLAAREPRTLFTPATVSDRSDGQITHLDGLNLSRAWCWRSIAGVMDTSDPRRVLAEQSAAEHLQGALPHVTGDYMGEHWLATFALLAMTE
ncbi:MAG: DUF2891 domain-containing protein [Phycisphaerales bacterium]|nr:DUF2891 domain-containing protein [Phycisphaerales bacterium]